VAVELDMALVEALEEGAQAVRLHALHRQVHASLHGGSPCAALRTRVSRRVLSAPGSDTTDYPLCAPRELDSQFACRASHASHTWSIPA
jgi:hypothetical protein